MVKIIGTGSYLPEKILTNNDLEKMVDTSDSWIVQRTGIKERRIVGENETTSDLAVKAGAAAIKNSGLTPNDIEMIIVATSTPDYHIPATAPIVQEKLGCKKIAAFDINSVCTSFVCSYVTAYGLISSGIVNNCLVIGVDVYSKILDWTDRNTCVIFGDGAGAVVLQRDKNNKGILACDLGTDGSGADYIKVPIGGTVCPNVKGKTYEDSDYFFQMAGKKVYEFTISIIPESISKCLKNASLDNKSIDWVICHQANIRIIDMISKTLDIDRSKFIVNIEKTGNTSSASIPIVIDEAAKSGKLKSGDKVLMVGFGGGLSWGCVIIEY